MSANGTPATRPNAKLFHDLPWQHIPALLLTITNTHYTLELATVIDRIRKDNRVAAQGLGTDPAGWPESPLLRQVTGDLAHEGKWIKRIAFAERTFQFALPLLPETSVIKSRLSRLWDWIQNE